MWVCNVIDSSLPMISTSRDLLRDTCFDYSVCISISTFSSPFSSNCNFGVGSDIDHGQFICIIKLKFRYIIDLSSRINLWGAHEGWDFLLLFSIGWEFTWEIRYF